MADANTYELAERAPQPSGAPTSDPLPAYYTSRHLPSPTPSLQTLPAYQPPNYDEPPPPVRRRTTIQPRTVVQPDTPTSFPFTRAATLRLVALLVAVGAVVCIIVFARDHGPGYAAEWERSHECDPLDWWEEEEQEAYCERFYGQQGPWRHMVRTEVFYPLIVPVTVCFIVWNLIAATVLQKNESKMWRIVTLLSDGVLIAGLVVCFILMSFFLGTEWHFEEVLLVSCVFLGLMPMTYIPIYSVPKKLHNLFQGKKGQVKEVARTQSAETV